MKKILLCLCLLAGYGMANDKSGAFVGFELGISELSMKTSNGDSNELAPMYGLRAGYQGYFNDYLGLAGYVSFKDSVSAESNSEGGTESKYDSHFMPIMANIDVLWDFYNGSSASYGAFVGIGLGGAIYTNSNLTSNISGFYSDVKVGLNSSFGHSKVSLIASFPFNQIKGTSDGVEGKLKQNYAVSLAYDFKF